MSVIYAASAVTDLKHIWGHYAERVTIRVANDVARRIRRNLESTIGRHKRAGRPRPEFGSGFRSIAAPPYIVFYVVDTHGARVVRILHGHRDVRPPLMSLLLAA